MGRSKIPESKLLPFTTICAAAQGDPDALTAVLHHFDGFIAAKSMRIFYDEYGQSYRGVDPILRRRIENKLIKRIVEWFEIK